LKFNIEKKLAGHLGRAGTLETEHGVIETPAFVTVGTKATVKSLTVEHVKACGAQVVLGNTYHLYLEPGDEIIKKAGGINKFMNWQGPTMTDSGGFQVFSLGAAYGKNLSKLLKAGSGPLLLPEAVLPETAEDKDKPRIAEIDPNGVTFKSHLNGDTHYITPEKSIEIQHNIGADIIFAFDECTSPIESYKYQQEALVRTHSWAEKSLQYHKSKTNSKTQALFGIVQGGRFEDLRKDSAAKIGSMDFDGFGIGGSFAKEDMNTAVKWVNEILPEEKPRHLLGIGEPEDLFEGVIAGVDLFDCVLPTRLGRNGTLYTRQGKIHIENTKYREDFTPIDEGCECYTCKNYTRAYVAHLFRAKEMLAGTLASTHNLYFIVNLVKKMRQGIIDGNILELRDNFLKEYQKN
jgi:queuine tRNA-ribosyltransferase